MQDQLAEILFYVKGTLRYKWVIIIAAWIVCCAGWFFVHSMPDEYQSKAIVNVDSRTMLRPLLRGMTVQTSSRGLIQVMRQLMFTRPKLERVAQLSELDIDSKSEAGKLSLVAKLKEGIKIDGGTDDLFTISYTGDDAKQAQSIVLSVLTVFSEQTQQRGINDTGSAQQFIEEQIREYEVRLKNAEKARENFKRVNSGYLPTESGGGLSTLSALQVQLEESQLSLSEMNSQMRVLKSQINEAMEMEGEDAGDEWGLGGVSEQISTPEDAQIAALQEQINGMLIRFTDNYPDVISLKLQIKDLQLRKEQTLANMSGDHGIKTPAVNPYIQALKMQLNQVQTQKASIQTRINVYHTRMEDVQKGMDARLRIETEMQNLDRDYSVIKTNYMNLITSRETAAMTEAADRSQGVLKFKIVEAPTAPLKPTGPKRTLLNSGFLAGGLLTGFLLAFLIYFIRPTFMSTLQLRQMTGLPVLGSVAQQVQEGESDLKSKIIFWSLFIVLLLAYVFVINIT